MDSTVNPGRSGTSPCGNAMAPDDAPFRITALAGALIYLFLEWADGNLGTDRAAFVDYCTQVIGQLLT